MTGIPDLRPVLLVTGILLAALGGSMRLPALVGLANKDGEWNVFLVCALITMLVGLSLFAATRGHPARPLHASAMLMTVVSWLALSNVGPALGEVIGPAGNYASINDAAK